MPTPNPRVNVTLSPSLDVLVQRMASLQRVSKSQVLRELLEAAEPALQRAAALMEAAQKAHAAVKEGLSRNLDKAQSEAEKHAASMLADMDRLAGDLVAQAESIQERRPRRPPQGAAGGASPRRNPPASNRGVKSNPKVSKRGKA